ncbi:hypothetical protein HYV83_01485 [Candidatus Woesearchaeota archaeon]|nr:hypothetical protein [Candidatus Woesearchaeota archaeon]
MPAAKKAKKGLKENIASTISGFSGLMGVFSSWTVCHNVCTAAIALLAIIGITVTGMPLLFLQSVAVPFWTAAVILLIVLLILKWRKMGCLSGKMLLLNAGLVVMGTPFGTQFRQLFWLVGGALVFAAAFSFVKGKVGRR